MGSVQIYFPSHLFNTNLLQHYDQCVIGKKINNNDLKFIVLGLVSTAHDLNLGKKNDLSDGNGKAYYDLGILSTDGKFKYHGPDFHTNDTHIDIIKFDAPSMYNMQFYSLRPIDLSINTNISHLGILKNTCANDITYECKNYEILKDTQRTYKNNKSNISEQSLLDTLNVFDQHVTFFEKEYSFVLSNKRGKYTLQLPIPIRWILSAFMKFLILLSRLFCELWFQIFKIFKIQKFSATGLQINLRCLQTCYFPLQYTNLGQRKVPVDYKGQCRQFFYSYLDYIQFYNTVWLICNDISLGMFLHALCLNSLDEIIPRTSEFLEFFFVKTLKKLTLFLNESPFGIKLNDELSRFLKELFLWIIDFSNETYIKHMISPDFLNQFFKLVTMASYFCGASFALSMCIDYLSLLSLHLKLFYRISCKLYRWQLVLMKSLFYLFRGKKINVLRQRVDNEAFPIDVLLIGILFFIILVFLLPTVFAFYFTYTILHYATVLVEISLESMVMLLNHFPLFLLMLRFKDSRRVPGGIQYKMADNKKNGKPYTLVLENVPLNFQQIFNSFRMVMDDLSYEYFSFNTLTNFLTGKDINIVRQELYAPLYLILPEEVISITDLYKLLQSASSKTGT